MVPLSGQQPDSDGDVLPSSYAPNSARWEISAFWLGWAMFRAVGTTLAS